MKSIHLESAINNGYPAFETIAVHGRAARSHAFGSTQVPVFDSAAFSYESPESISRAFAGKEFGFIYSRIANPTVAALEARLADVEGAPGAVAASSGMAAILIALLSLTEAGTRIVAGEGLFSGTYGLLNGLLKKFGVETVYVNLSDRRILETALSPNTALVYAESIGNPGLDVPDLHEVAAACEKRGVPLVADCTLSTPALASGASLGADAAIHSLTKFITGNGSAIGGAVVDTGRFDWSKHRFGAVTGFARFGRMAFLAALRKGVSQFAGPCLSPANARMHLLGIETLALRMERHCENAAAFASFLEGHGKVRGVNYPGRADNPQHAVAARQFGGRFGGVLTFRLASHEDCFRFLSKLKLARIQANMGDARTLVIHPASTIYLENSEEERDMAGVTSDLIRVSAGIERADDIIRDFEDALKEV